jgi:hypothetical protein
LLTRARQVLVLRDVARLPAIDTSLGEFNDAKYGRLVGEQDLVMIGTPFPYR